MTCSKCQTRNPIGNKFCRECGQTLAVTEGTLAAEETQRVEEERAREKAAGLLTQAYALLERNQIVDAIPLAEEASALLPASTAALSLCATLYERAHQNDKALAAMEKVVEFNPQSAVDRDKLDRMRRGVHLQPRISTAPIEEPEEKWRSWLPATAAGAVLLLVLGGGIWALTRSGKSSNARRTAHNRPPMQQNYPGGQAPVIGGMPAPGIGSGAMPNGAMPTGSGYNPGAQIPVPPPHSTNYDPFASAGAPNRPSNPAPGQAGQYRPPNQTGSGARPQIGDVNPGSTLPLPGAPLPGGPAPGGAGGSIPPVIVGPPRPIGSGNTTGNNGNGERFEVGPPTSGGRAADFGSGGGNGSGNGNNGGVNPPTNPSGSDNGSIRIIVNPPRNNGSGGSEGAGRSGDAPNDGQRISRGTPDLIGEHLLYAQSLQSSGRYRDAIAAYLNALSAGANPGECHQAMGLCYQRLGETAPAKSAYRDAIAAFEAQIKSGRGIGVATRGISACRAALEVLEG